MKSIKKNTALLIFCFSLSLVNAQYEIKPKKGYTPQIGLMVDMLEDLKDRVTEITRDLDQVETDYLFDAKANSIGAIIMHLVATEAYCQVETLEEPETLEMPGFDMKKFLDNVWDTLWNWLKSLKPEGDLNELWNRLAIRGIIFATIFMAWLILPPPRNRPPSIITLPSRDFPRGYRKWSQNPYK